MIEVWLEDEDETERPLTEAVKLNLSQAWAGLRVSDGMRRIEMRDEAVPFAGMFGASLAVEIVQEGHAVAYLWSHPGAYRFDREGAAVRVEADDGTWVCVPAAALVAAQRALTEEIANALGETKPGTLLRQALAQLQLLGVPVGSVPVTSGQVQYGPIHRSRGVSVKLRHEQLVFIAGGSGVTASVSRASAAVFLRQALPGLRAYRPARLPVAEGILRLEPTGAICMVRLPGQRVLEVDTCALLQALQGALERDARTDMC